MARQYGGIVNKLDLGDKGVKAILLFGAPYALEQKEEMAVRAAMDLAVSRDFPEGVRLAIGATSAHLFTGPIGSAGRQEYTVMGDGINLAARLMQRATPGQILCDLRCLRAASGAIQFKALPSITVKGKRHPILVAEPVGESEDEHGGGAALFEREALCERLSAFLSGAGEKPLALEGESGLGKTALLDWAMARAKATGLPATRAPLGPYSAGRPFAVWRGAVRSLMGINRLDPPEVVRVRRDAALAGEPEGYRPLLNSILDLPEETTPALKNLSPKERKDLTFAILGRLFAGAGVRLVACDNLHFADPLSLELLSFLSGGTEAAPPWRFLCAFRPEPLD